MKKIHLLSLLLFVFISESYSCDPISYSFCVSSMDYAEEKIFIGRIIDQDIDGTDLEIIEVLRGSESDNSIRVWDGTDIYCNGPFSMSTADYGSIGDTIICIVEDIDSLENAWDVIGDYRRPSSISHITYQTVINNSLWDWDSGQMVSLVEYVNNWSNSCSVVQSIIHLERPSLHVYPNPTSDYLFLENDNTSMLEYSIVTIDGSFVNPLMSQSNTNLINVKDLNAGVYFLRSIDGTGIESMTRFIKM